MNNPSPITLSSICEAAERISSYIKHTPVLQSEVINKLTGANVFLKCENLQNIGAFKMRGASNAVLSLSEEECKRGITTHSSGNHAQAIALAARNRGIKAIIVMPENAPAIKTNAVVSYGAEIVFCKPTLAAREAAVDKVVAETGAFVIHPYNNYKVIEGQATACLELMEEIEGLDIIITPVGGGGLLSGTSLSAHFLHPEIQVFGAEPEGADDAFRSLQEGRIVPSLNPKTIADGLLTSLGDKTFPIIRQYVKGILLVSDEEIVKAMKLLHKEYGLFVEPSGTVAFAALLKNKERFQGKKVGIILSGGNIDKEAFQNI